ncbi:MAG: type II toxin-antitoxin system PemK/MazF family toxin [Puniceicoccaceae bacterium]
MRRGTIIRVNLEDQSPPEFGKTRPAIILSNSEQNLLLPTVVVIPLSTRPPHIWPLRLAVPETGQLSPSFVVIPGIRQINKGRIMETIGHLPADFMADLEAAVSAYFGD